MQLHIVLVEPEIPQNTGNIARSCAVTGAALHLVHPLGFSTSDRYLKRAGLDYWDQLELYHHDSLQDFLSAHKDRELFFVSKKAEKHHSDITYPGECFLLFGKETKGLPEKLLKENSERCIRIPMRPGSRSLNLSNSVAIVAYEALRQKGYPDLE